MRRRSACLPAVLFALPLLLAPPLLAQSTSQGLGFSLQALTKEELDGVEKSTGHRVGVFIAAVAQGSPAERAGFKAGDVIFTVGSNGVASPQQMDAALAASTGNVECLVVRKVGEEFKPIKLTIAAGQGGGGAAAPAVGGAGGGGSPSAAAGLVLEAFPKEVLDNIEKTTGQRVGVLVADIQPASYAAEAGLHKGDILLGIADQGVNSPAGVDQILAGRGGKIDMLILRRDAQGKWQTMPLSLVLPPAAGGGGQPAAPSQGQVNADTQAKLKALDDARAAGVLSDEEYQQKRAALLGSAGTAGSAPKLAAGMTIYADAQSRFYFAHPKTWKTVVAENKQGVTVTNGKAGVTVMVFTGNGTADQLLTAVLEQIKKQTKNFSEVGRAKIQVAGKPALSVEFTGINPQGVDSRTRLVTVTVPGTGFCLLYAAGQKAFETNREVFDNVLKTFGVGAVPTGTAPKPGQTGAAPRPSPGVAQTTARTAGKTYKHPIGFEFWYPASWQVQPQGDQVIILTPPASAGEHYIILGDSVGGEGITNPGDPQVLAFLEQLFPQMRQGIPEMPANLQRAGQPTPIKMAKGQGIVADWNGQGQGGAYRVRAYVCIMSNFALGLLALGPADKVARRDGDLRAVFTSFGVGQGQVDPQLVGYWLNEKSFSSGGYGSVTAHTLHLCADGTFGFQGQFAANMQDTDALGNDAGSVRGSSGPASARGRWVAANKQLRLLYDDGSVSVYRYEPPIVSAGDRLMLMITESGEKQMWTFKGQ